MCFLKQFPNEKHVSAAQDAARLENRDPAPQDHDARFQLCPGSTYFDSKPS